MLGTLGASVQLKRHYLAVSLHLDFIAWACFDEAREGQAPTDGRELAGFEDRNASSPPC